MDRLFKLPRIWSNTELRKVASKFNGDIINISGYKDDDKEGGRYKDYFMNASNYYISNHPTAYKGSQGGEGEFLIDLENDLPAEVVGRFDVVFNHTVLEHIFKFEKAFKNLCLMSKDCVVVVVPFLQRMHGPHYTGGYGDYWRFTPLALQKLFEENGFETLVLTYNNHPNASVYVFCVASKNSGKWRDLIGKQIKFLEKESDPSTYVGHNAIPIPFLGGVKRKIFKLLKGKA